MREGMAWGLDADDARSTAVGVLEAVAEAASASHTDDAIGFLRELVPARAGDLLSGGTARRNLG